jgi:hypothetical protein
MIQPDAALKKLSTRLHSQQGLRASVWIWPRASIVIEVQDALAEHQGSHP